MRPYYLITLLFLTAAQLCSHAQDNLAFGDYDWNEIPDFFIPRADTTDHEIVLKESRKHEYFFRGDEFLEHRTVHRAIYLNNDQAIEANNKQYLPASSTVEIIREQARVIKPNGNIVELDEGDIQTYENEEDGSSYRYFALEGIEKGSIIELLTQRISSPTWTGSRVFFQRSVPVYDVDFELISPDFLHFGFKSYNGLQDVVASDTLYDKKNHYSLRLKSVPAFRESDQGAYTSNRKFAIYKLARNSRNNKNDFTSYGQLAQNLHGQIYTMKSKKIEKKLNVMLKESKVNLSRDEEDKVRTVETYLKERFRLIDSNAPVLRDLSFILENSVYSDWGATYLMANMLKLMEVKHEIVVTSDRFDIRFDKDFEAYIFLQDMLIYVPGVDKYVSPSDMFLRTGVIPSENAGNHGLFISEVKLGSLTSAIGKIKMIPETQHEDNQHNLEVTVNFGEDVYKPTINIKNITSGYYAQFTQPIYQYLDEDQQTEMLEGQLQYIDTEGEFTNVVTTNDRAYQFGQEPMIIEGEVESESFTESIGNNVLFKIGMLIGPQMEMYQEDIDKRDVDVETEYARVYHRTITVNIPEGYKLEGLDALKMNHVYSDEENNDMGFTSDYELTDEALIVIIEEYYKKQLYPKALFAKYLEVINAAADFNKATVVLQKL